MNDAFQNLKTTKTTSPAALIIREKDWVRIEAILRRMLPAGVQVWAYGSRVNGDAVDSSDLDLALVSGSENPLPHKVIRDIKTCLSESNVPIIVDIHDKASLPETFQRNFAKEAIFLFEQQP